MFKLILLALLLCTVWGFLNFKDRVKQLSRRANPGDTIYIKLMAVTQQVCRKKMVGFEAILTSEYAYVRSEMLKSKSTVVTVRQLSQIFAATKFADFGSRTAFEIFFTHIVTAMGKDADKTIQLSEALEVIRFGLPGRN